VPVKQPHASKTGGAEILLVAVALAAVGWMVVKRKPTPKPVAKSAPASDAPAKEQEKKDDTDTQGA
jgi:hypothetical protein